MKSRDESRTPAITRASSSGVRSGVTVSVGVMVSASLHGADDLDAVALVDRGRGPVAAAHDPAVQRDGDALRVLDAGLLGLDAEQGLDVGGLAGAGLPVDGQVHDAALTPTLSRDRGG